MATLLTSLSKKTSCDVAIVGGGIIGLMIALQLAQQGLSIKLFDRQAAGNEASFAGGGILGSLAPWQQTPAMLNLIRWSQQRYPALCDWLFSNTGVDPEYRQSGVAFVDVDLAPNNPARRYFRSADSSQAGHCFLEKPESGARFDSVSHQHIDLFDQVGQIRNPKLMQALTTYVRQNPLITLYEQTPCENWQLSLDGHRIEQIVAGGQTYKAAFFVLAAGAWSNTQLRQLGRQSDIHPVKGQMIRLQAKQPLTQTILIHQGHYLIPRNGQRFIFGSTLDQAGFSKRTDRQTFAQLYQRACALVPGLRDADVLDHWSGLRPATVLGAPTIGFIPGLNNGLIASGHFRYGLTTAPATAHLIESMILGANSEIETQPFRMAEAEEA